jgi:SagB-type dehydrogenase family enzyme
MPYEPSNLENPYNFLPSQGITLNKKSSTNPAHQKIATVSLKRSLKSTTAKHDTPVFNELSPIRLPPPLLTKGLSVPAALKKRHTTRPGGGKIIYLQTISNILWAACGVNRKNGPFDNGGRTAASASNAQEIDIYVLLSEGIYLYDSLSHALHPVAHGDYRFAAIGAGQQGAGAEAPVRFVYIVDLEIFKNAGFQEPGLWDPEIQKAYYYVDTGMIAANVYLYAASQGLAAWFHNCDKVTLAKVIKLRPGQRILFGQTVGKL